MRITSRAVEPFGSIPAKHTCDGAGTNPMLVLADVPPATKSLALIVFDPDVPKAVKADGRYLHWALWNLPPTVRTIEEGRGGGLSENGGSGWVPPCPPSGEHRYVFQAFALDMTLRDRTVVGEDDLRSAIQGHVLGQAELVGRYSRPTLNRLNVVLGGLVLLTFLAVAYRFVRARRAS